MTTDQNDPINWGALVPTGSREIVGVLLAGGRSSRFGGGDKCRQRLGGKTLLEHVALNAAAQVGALILNVNGDADRFPGLGPDLGENLGLAVVKDTIDGFCGPLAGVLAAMDYVAEHEPQARWVASFATDAPFVPVNWVRLVHAAIIQEGAQLGCVASHNRVHPVCGLWPVDLRFQLRTAIEDEAIRKVRAWTARYKMATVTFESDPVDPFFNINTPDDLAAAEILLAQRQARSSI